MSEQLNLDAERAAFEAWIGLNDREGPQADRYEDTYTDNYVGEMWEAWQASAARRAAPVVIEGLPPLPKRACILPGVYAYCDEHMTAYARSAIAADRAAREKSHLAEMAQWARDNGLNVPPAWEGAVINYDSPVDKQSVDTPEFRDLVDALLNAYWSPEPYIAALIAYIDGRTAGAAPAWQPIETAPKDQEIWAFNGEQGRMKWSEGDCWALWIWADELLQDADPSPDQPTHWAPLLAAPSPQQGKEGA